MPDGFLLDAFLIERDQAHQDVVVGQVGRPAIGGCNGGIQLVVVIFQDQHQAVVEDAAVLGGEGIGRGAGAEFLQHVVEAGQREVRVFGKHAFAVGVKFLGESADALFLQVVGGREGEWVEAAGFYVDGIIALSQASSLA